MDSKILVGLLTVFGFVGTALAFAGFGHAPAGGEGIPAEIMEQFRAALDAGDYETVNALSNEYGFRPPFMRNGTGERMPPFGGFGNGARMMQNVSIEVRAQFLQAMTEGDYETAKALSEEYDLGGRFMRFMNETSFLEMVSFRNQMQDAISAGDYETAVELRDQLKEQMKTSVQAGIKGSFQERAGMEKGQTGGSMGHRPCRHHPLTS